MIKYTITYENSFGDRIEFSKKQGFYRLYNDIVEDLSGNEVTIKSSSANYQVGSTVTGQEIAAKTITFNGDILKSSLELRNRLIDTIIPNDTGKMYIEVGGIEYNIECIPKKTPIIENKDLRSKFQFQLYFPYPFFYDGKGEKKLSFGELTSTYKYPQSFSSTVKWYISTRGNSVLKTIKNTSGIEIGFRVVFKCSAHVPTMSITNSNTQEKIELNCGTLITDCTNYTFEVSTYDNDKYVKVTDTSGNASEMDALISDDSEFFKIHLGDNPIAITDNENLEVEILYRQLKAGI